MRREIWKMQKEGRQDTHRPRRRKRKKEEERQQRKLHSPWLCHHCIIQILSKQIPSLHPHVRHEFDKLNFSHVCIIQIDSYNSMMLPISQVRDLRLLRLCNVL